MCDFTDFERAISGLNDGPVQKGVIFEGLFPWGDVKWVIGRVKTVCHRAKESYIPSLSEIYGIIEQFYGIFGVRM